MVASLTVSLRVLTKPLLKDRKDLVSLILWDAVFPMLQRALPVFNILRDTADRLCVNLSLRCFCELTL